MNTLSAENSLVLIIDIQERLVSALNKDVIVENAVKVASAAKYLDIPVLLTEQYIENKILHKKCKIELSSISNFYDGFFETVLL